MILDVTVRKSRFIIQTGHAPQDAVNAYHKFVKTTPKPKATKNNKGELCPPPLPLPFPVLFEVPPLREVVSLVVAAELVEDGRSDGVGDGVTLGVAAVITLEVVVAACLAASWRVRTAKFAASTIPWLIMAIVMDDVGSL